MYDGGTDTDTSRNVAQGRRQGLGQEDLRYLSPRTASTFQGWEEIRVGAPDPASKERPCPRCGGVPAGGCGGSGVPVAAVRRWQPLPVSGCHLVSRGRRAVRQGGLQALSIARSQPESIAKQPGCWDRSIGIGLGAGTPTPGTAHPAASTAADPKGGQLAQPRSYRGSKAQGSARAGSGVPGAARA